MIVGSLVPNASIRFLTTSVAPFIASLMKLSSPARVGVMTIRLPSTRRTSQSRWPLVPTPAVCERTSSKAASTRVASRTKKVSEPLLVETSPISIGGSARRICDRTWSSIAARRDLATSSMSASSRMWLPPARSRPKLMRGRAVRCNRCELVSPIRLGMARKTPSARAREIAKRFQRGKSSIGSVVRRLGAERADVAQHRLEDADAHALGDFELDLAVVDLGDLADDAAAGHRDVVLLDRADQRLVLLRPLLLRADEEEIEDDEDEKQREHLHQEARPSRGRGAGLCVSGRGKHGKRIPDGKGVGARGGASREAGGGYHGRAALRKAKADIGLAVRASKGNGPRLKRLPSGG